MKSSIRKSTYKAIYKLLDKVSPIDGDCGTLCNAACCTCEGDSTDPEGTDFDLGIYLLPGEEKLFTGKEDWLKWSVGYAEDYDFPESWSGKVYFIRCKTPPSCPREMRPLQCRFYPLAPHINENDELQMILSTTELPYKCPLIEDRMELNPDFIKATYTVWRRLIKDVHIFDMVMQDSDDRIESGIELVVF